MKMYETRTHIMHAHKMYETTQQKKKQINAQLDYSHYKHHLHHAHFSSLTQTAKTN